jgi:LysM repeat protein
MTSLVSFSQKKELVMNYILTYKDIAMAEMQRTGVPAAITLAQGIHESGAGNSELVLQSNNHFGIKCKSNWTGETVYHDDDARGECFRKYPQAENSYRDHSDFLKAGQRYAFLFNLDPTDYQGWAKGLKQAGYATNPKYPEVLIKLIEDYHLQDYTMLAMGKQPASNDNAAVTAAVTVTTSSNNAIQSAVTTNTIEQVTTNYPSGDFKINETKVVFVKQGTSFLAIAKQYDVDLSKIFEFNELDRMESVPFDQLVYLQRKRKTGNNEVHVVKTGETLKDIAREEAIRLESLAELNWIKETDQPAIGETLNLKTKSTTIPKLIVRENYSLVPAVKKSTH